MFQRNTKKNFKEILPVEPVSILKGRMNERNSLRDVITKKVSHKTR